MSQDIKKSASDSSFNKRLSGDEESMEYQRQTSEITDRFQSTVKKIMHSTSALDKVKLEPVNSEYD